MSLILIHEKPCGIFQLWILINVDGNFTNFRMGAEGMEAMADSLGSTVSISTLLMPGNCLGDVGMESLSKGLIYNTNTSIEVRTI